MLQGFVHLMLDVFYPVCRDLLELQRLLREMLPKVVAAQLADQNCALGDKRGRVELHAVARPVLKDALQRQFYSVCALAEAEGPALDGAAAVAAVDDREDRRSKSTVFELPLYTKYLRKSTPLLLAWALTVPGRAPCVLMCPIYRGTVGVRVEISHVLHTFMLLTAMLLPPPRCAVVAAYLASHVLPKNDKLYFTRAGMTKARRKAQPAQADSLVHMQPKPFALERLVAIFGALHPSSSAVPEDDLRGLSPELIHVHVHQRTLVRASVDWFSPTFEGARALSGACVVCWLSQGWRCLHR